MQIFSYRSLMDQCDWRGWQRFLRLDALGNVTKLFSVFLVILVNNNILNNNKYINQKRKKHSEFQNFDKHDYNIAAKSKVHFVEVLTTNAGQAIPMLHP